MELYHTPHGLNDYLNRTFTCPCGKTHSAPLKYVSVRKVPFRTCRNLIRNWGSTVFIWSVTTSPMGLLAKNAWISWLRRVSGLRSSN